MYGQVDGSLTQYKNASTKITGVSDSQLGSSLIGFKGEEDLGGGMKGIFKLEGGLDNSSGIGKASNSNNQMAGSGVTVGNANSLGGQQGLVFQRYAHVGVAGSFGEIRLGRDYTAAFQWGVAAVDVFGTNGPASGSNIMQNLGIVNKQPTNANASNMIGYITPNISGFEAKMQAFYGENKSNSTTAGSAAKEGDGASIGLRYTTGPLMVAYATQTTKGTVNAAVASTSLATNGNYKQSGLSASYDLGVAKLVFTNAAEDLIKTAGTSTTRTNLLGVVVPMGAINLKASYGMSTQNTGVSAAADTKATLLGLGADYSLSKRTVAYGTYGKISNKNSGTAYYTGVATTVANNSSTGLAVGIKHSF